MNKHKYILIIFSTFLFSNLLANDAIPFNSLVFKNELERNSFTIKNGNNEAFLQMLCTVNSNVNITDVRNIETTIEDIYDHLRQKNITNKTPLKAAALIHHTFHKKLFKSFKKYSYFDEIFFNGNYNCATATAVLALAFDHFNIKYSIQEQRKHVFIIIQDRTNYIMVESTDKTNGVYIMDKKSMLQQWANLNLIQLDKDDFTDYDSLFKTCTKTDLYSINFRKLVANLYTNSAILMNKNEEYEAAEQMMQKSLYLYNDREEKFRTSVNINHLMLKIDIYQLETLQPVLRLIKHKEFSEIAQNELIGLFEYATKYLLLEQQDFKTHQALSLYISEHLNRRDYQDLFKRMDFVNSYYNQYLTFAN